MVIVLHEQSPQRIVDGIVGVAVALRVTSDIGDVVQVGRALAYRQSQCAGVVDELAQINWTAKLFAVPARMRIDHVCAEFQLMPAVDRRQHIVELVLAVHQ